MWQFHVTYAEIPNCLKSKITHDKLRSNVIGNNFKLLSKTSTEKILHIIITVISFNLVTTKYRKEFLWMFGLRMVPSTCQFVYLFIYFYCFAELSWHVVIYLHVQIKTVVRVQIILLLFIFNEIKSFYSGNLSIYLRFS